MVDILALCAQALAHADKEAGKCSGDVLGSICLEMFGARGGIT